MPRKKPQTPPVVLPTNDPNKVRTDLLDVMREIKDELSLPSLPGSNTRQKIVSTYKPQVRIRPSPIAYIPIDRSQFQPCTYDLGEIARCADTDGYARLSVQKHFTLCMKEGWNLVGKDSETISYIRQRLFELEMATTVAFDSLLRDTLLNLIKYSNAFIVLRRDADLSSGKLITKFGALIDPIAGMFAADPTSMRIRRNKWGEIKGYKQVVESDKYVSGEEKEFTPDLVLHFFYDRKTGMAWGTPYMVPILDDIRLLRNIEEVSNLVCHKGAFPFYHYQVGTETLPAIDYEDGTSEITEVESQIRAKPLEGVFVTPERHKIVAVDAQGAIRNLQPYLEYFRQRVISGLNLSSVDVGIGDSSNRSTATQMSKSLQNQCKDFQKVVCILFTQLFDDLLAEGGFKITIQNRVNLSFPEIDIETQQLVNNHAMAMYQGNVIDEDEMRKMLGKEPFEQDQHSKRHLGMVQMPLLELQRQAQASIAAERSTAPSTNSTSAKNQPTNQYGTKGSRGATKNDSVLRSLLDDAEKLLLGDLDISERLKLSSCIAEELGSNIKLTPFEITQIEEKIRYLNYCARDSATLFVYRARNELPPFIESILENRDEISKKDDTQML